MHRDDVLKSCTHNPYYCSFPHSGLEVLSVCCHHLSSRKYFFSSYFLRRRQATFLLSTFFLFVGSRVTKSCGRLNSLPESLRILEEGIIMKCEVKERKVEEKLKKGIFIDFLDFDSQLMFQAGIFHTSRTLKKWDRSMTYIFKSSYLITLSVFH